METLTRNVKLIAQLSSKSLAGRGYRRWARHLLIAEAWLLLLIASGAGLVTVWLMLNNIAPLPTIATTRASQPARSPVAMTNCVVRDAGTKPVPSHTCIREN